MVDLQYALQAGRQCRKGRPPVRVMLPAVQHHHVPDHHYYCPADPYLDTFYYVLYALQIMGQWESKINVWFPVMYSQKRHCYFPNRIIMFCLPVPTLIDLWEIYYFQDRFAYSAAGKYVDRSWEYINRSQTHECGNWDWGRAIPSKGIHKLDFPCSVWLNIIKSRLFVRGSYFGFVFFELNVLPGDSCTYIWCGQLAGRCIRYPADRRPKRRSGGTPG